MIEVYVLTTYLDIIDDQMTGKRLSSARVQTWAYTANRNRTLNQIYDNGIDNEIFLSSDSHCSRACLAPFCCSINSTDETAGC